MSAVVWEFGQTLEEPDTSVIPDRAAFPDPLQAPGEATSRPSGTSGTIARSSTRWPSAISGPSTSRPSSGVLWAVLSPVATLAIFVVVFSRVKTFGSQGLPYPLYAFVGILCWSFFSTSLGNGGQLAPQQQGTAGQDPVPSGVLSPGDHGRPRPEHHDLLDPARRLLFVIFGRAPKLATLWVPMFMVIEVVFAAGVGLSVVQRHHPDARPHADAPHSSPRSVCSPPRSSGRSPRSRRPTTWPAGTSSRRPLVTGHLVHAHWVGGFTINLQMVYGFFNPLGPVIAEARNTMLLGRSPTVEPRRRRRLGAIMYLRCRLPHLQEVGGELCRHCLTGRSQVEDVWKKFRADKTVPKFYDQMKRFGKSLGTGRAATTTGGC